MLVLSKEWSEYESNDKCVLIGLSRNSPTSKILDLNISGQNLVAKDIAELVRHVQWMKSLKSINVANNALDDACAVYLGRTRYIACFV